MIASLSLASYINMFLVLTHTQRLQLTHGTEFCGLTGLCFKSIVHGTRCPRTHLSGVSLKEAKPISRFAICKYRLRSLRGTCWLPGRAQEDSPCSRTMQLQGNQNEGTPNGLFHPCARRLRAVLVQIIVSSASSAPSSSSVCHGCDPPHGPPATLCRLLFSARDAPRPTRDPFTTCADL